ncbi:DUF6907 domain-containing protein [Streptomyces asiaticus]|uniref:DUF6907 domain-containing protein n=1 Tax=Streptomyces asiaticus TaxID=114695 RepID=UPI003F67C5E9
MNTNHLSQVTSAKLRAALPGIPQQPATEAADRQARTVTVTIRGAEATITCPAWCVSPHTEKYAFLEDVSHHGEEISLPVRQYDGSTEQILTTHLAQWPFADNGDAYVSVDADGSGECNEYRGPAGLAFADQLVAHAERIRAEVAKLNGAQS